MKSLSFPSGELAAGGNFACLCFGCVFCCVVIV